MARADAETDLLFGILALQVGLVEQADLLDAFQRWSRDKTRRLAQVLVNRGALAPDDRTMLEGLVGRHLEKHGGDAERSLAAVAAPPALVTGLRHLGDPDVEATLDRTPCLIDDRPPIRDAADTALTTEGDSDATTDWTSGPGPSGLGPSRSDGGRFRPLRPHARGGIGMVSVALDSELHREVALKEILAEQADNVASRARFLLEAEVTGQLEHPGVVPVYALGTNGQGRPFYAMRFIRGESLKEAIVGFHKSRAPRGERALALRRLLSRFVGVCDTMAYAHSRGVLHRDLKPSNIMLGPYGETLVVDWGLAKLVGRDDPSNEPSAEATLRSASASGSSETEAGSIVGTPAYMSPEQAEGRLELLGPLSDVYSLGATLYCLLTGRPPFEDEIIAVLRQVRRGEFPPPRQVEPQVPRALEAVALKAMALQPQDRYDSARELARDIERWLADEPVLRLSRSADGPHGPLGQEPQAGGGRALGPDRLGDGRPGGQRHHDPSRERSDRRAAAARRGQLPQGRRAAPARPALVGEPHHRPGTVPLRARGGQPRSALVGARDGSGSLERFRHPGRGPGDPGRLEPTAHVAQGRPPPPQRAGPGHRLPPRGPVHPDDQQGAQNANART